MDVNRRIMGRNNLSMWQQERNNAAAVSKAERDLKSLRMARNNPYNKPKNSYIKNNEVEESEKFVRYHQDQINAERTANGKRPLSINAVLKMLYNDPQTRQQAAAYKLHLNKDNKIKKSNSMNDYEKKYYMD